MSLSSDPVDVAVGVLRDDRGRVLIARRPAGKPLAGLWEFPGGKVERDETLEDALAREMAEELGIRVESRRPLITLDNPCGEGVVRLHVFEVTVHEGRPVGRENQDVQWVPPGSLGVFDMPAANAAIVKAVNLPRLCLITDIEQFGFDRTVARLKEHTRRERVLVVVREKTMDRSHYRSLVKDIVRITRSAHSVTVVHSDCDYGTRVTADGVHWSASRLVDARSGEYLDGASCHTREELRTARDRKMDYTFLSPVKQTASHPRTKPLGWRIFASLCRGCGVPVYALGGLEREDFRTAIEAGAQGIAMLGAAWR